MERVRPADPRFLMRASFVAGLFWLQVWNDVFSDLCGADRAR